MDRIVLKELWYLASGHINPKIKASLIILAKKKRKEKASLITTVPL
jgi:hypothetical protein